VMSPPSPIFVLLGSFAALILHVIAAGIALPATVVGRLSRTVTPDIHTPMRRTAREEREHHY
jgi:hypothetical protein